MDWTREGRVWTFGDNVNADVAVGFSADLSLRMDEETLRSRCMVGYDPEFPLRARAGDFILAGRNFGCGHVHAQFYMALRYFGIGVILAESAGFRLLKQMINYGVPILSSSTVSALRQSVEPGQRVRANLAAGRVENLDNGAVVTIEPLHPYILGILERGGIFGEATGRTLGL